MTNIPIPSISDIFDSYGELRGSTSKGVPGIVRWESGVPGPNVAITAVTHGNEPSGFAPYWYLRNIAPHVRPARGTLTFTANNLEGADRFFSATDQETKRRSRVVDVNMNRIPEDFLDLNASTQYEVRRARELYAELLSVDMALDIHSTAQDSDPMILQIKGSVDHLTAGLPIPVSIDDIAAVQVGIPFCSTYGGIEREIPVFEIEAGSHEHADSYRLAIRAALVFLLNSGIVDDPAGELRALKVPELVRRHYAVVDSVILPDESYELSGDYPMFSKITQGEVLATGNGAPVLSPLDGHAIFAPGKRKPVNFKEEALFLTLPVEERTVSSS